MATLNLQNCKEEPKQFLVPYQRNPGFIGRVQFLETLKEKLFDIAPKRNNHRIALYGMGGIGKTQCALGYVYGNRDIYDRIYWITAVDRTSLLSGYQSIAKVARLQYLQNARPIEIADAVLSWLRQERSWLLVIDNLDDVRVADGLLPENGSQKHTIITTRNPNADGIPAEAFEVPLLDTNDSIGLLSTLSQITVQPDSVEAYQAAEIVRRLGYLPLAIEQAAAYVREVTADFSSFLEEYERNHRKLYNWVPAGNRQYPNSIATTWSMSFQMLQKYPARLLRLFSFLNPDSILIAFLVSGAEALEDELRHIIFDQIELSTALFELEKFSLIKWDRPNKSITIHRLVQIVVSDEMSDEELRSTLTNVIDLFNEAFPKFITNETRSVCRTYQGQMIEPLLRMMTMRTAESALIRRRVGKFLYQDGKYDDSERLLLQAVETYASVLGTDNSDTLSAMHELALTYQAQGRNADAASIQEQVLENRGRILGEEHPDTLSAMNNLAYTYQAQGRNADAARIEEEVLTKGRRILGEEHPDTLSTMNNLACTYQAQGRNADAARIQEEVLEKRRRILGEEHPDTLTAMNNLARTYQAQGRNADAVRIQEEVLEKRRRILGEEHPDTLTAMHNLAWTYQAKERRADAARIEEEVLIKRRRILGEEHPDTLRSMNNLASTYWQQGRMKDAAELEEEVLCKRKMILGDEHPDTLTSMNNLALTYLQQGRMKEAAELEEEVLCKRKMILGDEHPDTLMTMNNVAETYAQQRMTKEATELHEEVLSKRRKTLGENHIDTLSSLNRLAESYTQQGRTNDACRLQEELLDKRIKILGDSHRDTLETMTSLAALYRQQGRHLEATQLQEKVFAESSEIIGYDNPDRLVCMNDPNLTTVRLLGGSAYANVFLVGASEFRTNL